MKFWFILLFICCLKSLYVLKIWHLPIMVREHEQLKCVVYNSIECIWHDNLYKNDEIIHYKASNNRKDCLLNVSDWLSSIKKKVGYVQCLLFGIYGMKKVTIFINVLIYLVLDNIGTQKFNHNCVSKDILFEDYYHKKVTRYPRVCFADESFEEMQNLFSGSFNNYIYYIKKIPSHIILPVHTFGENITILFNSNSFNMKYMTQYNKYWLVLNIHALVKDDLDIILINALYGQSYCINLILHISEDFKIHLSNHKKLFISDQYSEKNISRYFQKKLLMDNNSSAGVLHMLDESVLNNIKDAFELKIQCFSNNCQYKFDHDAVSNNESVTEKSISTYSIAPDKDSEISRFSRMLYFSFTGSVILIFISIMVIIINCLKKKRMLCYDNNHVSKQSLIWMTNEKYGIQDSLFDYNCLPLSHMRSKVGSRVSETITQCTVISAESEPLFLPNYSTLEFDSYSNKSDNTCLPIFSGNISELNIKLKCCIGSGAFGKVFLGEIFYCSDSKNQVQCKIAAKEIMQCDSTTSSLFSEMSLMKRIGSHQNIVTLIGYCKRENLTDLLIMEYCSKGSLKSYLNFLNERDQFPLITFKRFSHEIAHGMEYLSSKNVIHRDLAARNVLLSEEYVCKISDFGMSRQLPVNESYYRHVHGIVPLKWMAPEVLVQHKYSTQADVWSYGILLWEIFSVGANPYETFPMNQVTDLINHGYRMPIPKRCPLAIIKLIQNCWNFEPSLRPTFKDIVKGF